MNKNEIATMQNDALKSLLWWHENRTTNAHAERMGETHNRVSAARKVGSVTPMLAAMIQAEYAATVSAEQAAAALGLFGGKKNAKRRVKNVKGG